MIDFRERLRPLIENAALTAAFPPTPARLRRWIEAGITVRGRPDWVFIKLHCHGMDPRDEAAMFGAPMQAFLAEIESLAQNGRYRPHYLTARELVNIALAACDGREGDPGQFRDYRLKPIVPR